MGVREQGGWDFDTLARRLDHGQLREALRTVRAMGHPAPLGGTPPLSQHTAFLISYAKGSYFLVLSMQSVL